MPQDAAFPNLGGLTYSEDVFYRLLDDLFSSGVVGATDYQVIQNHLGANMSVDVNPGSAYVPVTNGGKRRARLPAQSNSGTPGLPNSTDNWTTTFVAADATNPRIDRVVLTVQDSSVDGSGSYRSILRVIAGTPTSGATLANLNGAAAVPANSILLANVLVPANATTIVTGNIANIAAFGGIKTGKVTTSPFAGGPPPNPVEGDIWVATAVDANTTRWMFSYESLHGRWECIGGTPVPILDTSAFTVVNSAGSVNQIRASTTFPRTGLYEIVAGAFNGNCTAGGAGTFSLGVMVNSVLQGVLGIETVPAGYYFDIGAVPFVINYTAGQPMQIAYGANNSGTNGNASLAVLPIWVV